MQWCSPRTLIAGLLLATIIVSSGPMKAAEETSIASRIRRTPVESRALAAVGYSKRLRALEIEFRNGAIYRYLQVSPSVHKAFMDAPSKARFYHGNIRGKYRALHVRRRAQ